jgi:hypothetical protein
MASISYIIDHVKTPGYFVLDDSEKEFDRHLKIIVDNHNNLDFLKSFVKKSEINGFNRIDRIKTRTALISITSYYVCLLEKEMIDIQKNKFIKHLEDMKVLDTQDLFQRFLEKIRDTFVIHYRNKEKKCVLVCRSMEDGIIIDQDVHDYVEMIGRHLTTVGIICKIIHYGANRETDEHTKTWIKECAIAMVFPTPGFAADTFRKEVGKNVMESLYREEDFRFVSAPMKIVATIPYGPEYCCPFKLEKNDPDLINFSDNYLEGLAQFYTIVYGFHKITFRKHFFEYAKEIMGDHI